MPTKLSLYPGEMVVLCSSALEGHQKLDAMQGRLAFRRSVKDWKIGLLTANFQRKEQAMAQATPLSQGTQASRILLFSMELSNKKWLLTFGDGGTNRRKTEIVAADLTRFESEIRKAKEKFKVASAARVVSCYEAGRDGFWIHRWLKKMGIENYVVDSASIEVNRRRRRAKSDRLDGEALLRKLAAYVDGRDRTWSVVRVPDEGQEDARRLHREMERLTKERGGHRSRIKSLLALNGVSLALSEEFLKRLGTVRKWNGEHLGTDLQADLKREYERLQLVEEQMRAIRAERKARLKVKAKDVSEEKRRQQIRSLKQLKGINWGAWVLATEFFSWREFKNRRQVGALAGLTGTPYDSGSGAREQGISKAGNRRVRALMIELAWCWLRYQPNSKISKWYAERYGKGGKRTRRVGIVAVARQLLVALWRYVEFAEIPEGAELKAA